MLSYDTSTPHVPQTNGMPENVLKEAKERTACILSQSGLCDAWWKEAMECFCFLRSVVDTLWTNTAAYAMRFGENFRGPLIPMGAEVRHFLTSQSDRARVHEMSDKWLTRFFHRIPTTGRWRMVRHSASY